MKKRPSEREKVSLQTRAYQLKAHIRARTKIDVPIEDIVKKIKLGHDDAAIIRDFDRRGHVEVDES